MLSQNRFREEDDDFEVVQDLFKEIDKDGSGNISSEELREALKKYQKTDEERALSSALEKMLLQVEGTGTGEVSPEQFRNAVKVLPRVRGQRVQWARTLNLHEKLAKLLKRGNFFDGLKGLKDLDDNALHQHITLVCAKFSSELPNILHKSLQELRRGGELSAKDFQNSKFCMDATAFTGSFAELDDFYAGPEKLIGTPNPKIWEGIKREHCERKNCSRTYRSPNYNFDFIPRQEYDFVISPNSNEVYPHTPKHKDGWTPEGKAQWKGEEGRESVELQIVMKRPEVSLVGLKQGEVASLRLYTGPMYMLYNAVMRKFPKDLYDEHVQDGNMYETTIFCIISGISKLSRVTKLPNDRRVYRGLGGMILPEGFWKANNADFRGGIEWGLMSTTTNRAVAINYSGVDKKRGTVFEITVGRIDIGADLSWVSQYPGEAEILFPPLTCLEVVGEPRVEGEVIVFPLHANMNLKGLTLEQLEERRKLLHLSMAKNLREELFIQASTGQTKASHAMLQTLSSMSQGSCPARLFEYKRPYSVRFLTEMGN